ncbi:MAG: Rieske (2Fe-2S) protein [Pyrinomonadaceae bacterium]
MGKLHENPRQPVREGKKITVGKVTDLPQGRGATVELKDGSEIALFNVGGKFHAIENFCPHKAATLADGSLRGQIIECSRHGWKFDVTTGECFNSRSCSIEAYEVIVEDEMIKILV